MKRILTTFLAFAMAMSILFAGTQRVEAAALTNDRYINNQTHLKLIGADAAWKLATGNQLIKIAVLDTGVDYNHPDLQGNLLPGVNLVNPSKSAQDDSLNGHGTAVTGVLAARGNNGIGVSGVLWNARILPIKVLDKYGETDVELLAKGIQTAIDRGAKIILMSVSSMSYSKSLTAAVLRAEASGVLVVAASGNEANRVAYPAAYPTVVAVGAVRDNLTPLHDSNTGPELNLVAPGFNIYTTKPNGKYGTFSGTSAAAPQVAGAAALLLARYPNMTPLDIRQMLYQTAFDLGERGWDRQTGYGMVNLGDLLTEKQSLDFHEPNNTRSQAKAFPIESQLRAQLSEQDVVDWYFMDIPYDGKVTFVTTVTSPLPAPLAISFFSENRDPSTYYVGNGDTLTVPAKAGRMYIKMERSGGVNAFTYLMTSRFLINPDRYEPNNTIDTARPLVGNQISVIGNFHVEGDEDWFSYYVREYGRLKVTVTADTKRIDLNMKIGKEGEGWEEYDTGDRNDPTERAEKEVSPGKYYIRLTEYWKNQVNGEYKLDLSFTPVVKDTNEPNDTYRQASPLAGGTMMIGTLPTHEDQDWFYFTVESESYVSIKAPIIPVSSGVRLELYGADTLNYALYSTNDVAQLSDQGKEVLGMKLKPGKYYIKLNSFVPFKYETYRLTVTKQPLIEGYRDISSHWAKSDIARLSRKGVVKGFDDATFQPDNPVTRGQFATMLIQSMRAKGINIVPYTGASPFGDLTTKHWAYGNLLTAHKLGIIQGYPNGTISPDQSITRAEMALMVARANDLLLYKRSTSSFADLPTSHWASPAVEALVAKKWISGYGQIFKPQGRATRAEVVVLLAKAYNL
ncbi:S8 family serine peptidase [Brevibacillus ruminantium]|uniref:S8 family serine peptidase n=1 Tax=Brevibacillus ruminantium TaxID=2950604 RepID=A0ABY4WH42_9BACL|nr:S8 family serine peptidase [Brevibacillus ruminantium]USG65342.1 S8 family serine peptidase [Brevibacillus ruminantium]